MRELKDNPKLITFKNMDETSKTQFVYACGECGKAWGASHDGANKCCKQEYCDCGKKKRSYFTKCSECLYHDKLENSVTLNSKAFKEPVYCYETDTYYSDIDEFYESDDSYIDIKYLWACEVIEWKGPCSTDIIESELDNHHEDASDHIEDIDGLDKFLHEWNKKQTLKSWSVDYKRKIKL